MFNLIYWYYGVILLALLHCVDVMHYVVNTDQCRIVDPKSIKLDEFHRLKYKQCTKLQPLTRVAYNPKTKHYEISINQTVFQRYLQIDLRLAIQSEVHQSCCYMRIERLDENSVGLEEQCRNITNGGQLPNDSDGFIVQCYANGMLIYTNGHATVPERKHVRQRLDKWANDRRATPRAPSLLLIGIDTISRLHLMRAMPETRKYLLSSGWFEMAGYNKVADNTLPNLLPMTTGYTLGSVRDKCNPLEEGGLEKCEFIWKLYEQLGYVTAFGEDDTPINTFNYHKPGFRNPPVDYYMRSYLIAVESWLDGGKQGDKDSQVCLGYQHASEHVYNYALEFAKRYRNDSFFGFFWTNTHSHGESISLTSSMDSYMRKYLQRLVQQGTTEHSVLVFVSDHGMRGGPTRVGRLGWLEERLPFLFIWLPPYLRLLHPEFVDALQLNRNRLTSPFDLYVTLKHILQLSSPGHALGGAADCPRCQSLLQPVPLNRSCADAGIAEHWCTCWSYKSNQKHTPTDYKMAEQVFNYIKNHSTAYRNGVNLDDPMTMVKIWKAYTANKNKADDPHVSLHRIQLKVKPLNQLYEATVRYNSSSGGMLITGISLL